MNSIVDVASQYFQIKRNSHNSWIIDEEQFNSVVLFEDNNTYHRFSSGETGDIYKFLVNIVGLKPNEAVEFRGDVQREKSLLEVLHKSLKEQKKSERVGYDYEEFIGRPGYNAYVESRNITESTARFYGIEIDGPDVLFPLFNDRMKRVGSIKRHAYAATKADRYRTFLLHGHDKPCCWDFRQMLQLTPDTTVVLVEGTWSAMRIKQVCGHFPIVPFATMGAAIQPELFDYIYQNKIVAILDDDTGGERYTRQLQVARKKGIIVTEVKLNNKGQNIYVDDLTDSQMLKLFSKLGFNEV